MVWNKPTLISLPTALAGLVLGCMPSLAHAHGNNPRQDAGVGIWNRVPNRPNVDTITDPPADTANAQGIPGGNPGPGPGAMDLLGELGVNLGENVAFGAAGPDLGLGALWGADFEDLGSPDALAANGNYIVGPIDADLLTAAMDRGFHSTSVQSGPQGGAIPAPGTLALLALAGAGLAGRRRRRT